MATKSVSKQAGQMKMEVIVIKSQGPQPHYGETVNLCQNFSGVCMAQGPYLGCVEPRNSHTPLYLSYSTHLPPLIYPEGTAL